ncbi:hypothetical protein QE152_g9169 [Popillia japonica]|uniref:Uncharacterized protein n=1 Tax=Popillia japonica TaxID=7064 RepID=A0AAW1LZV8_POPJA
MLLTEKESEQTVILSRYRKLKLNNGIYSEHIPVASVLKTMQEQDLEKIVKELYHKLEQLLITKTDEIKQEIKTINTNITGLQQKYDALVKRTINLENIKKLKGSNIAIAHDLCPEDLRKRKQLYECYKKAKNNGLNAQIKHNSLYINGKCISITEEQDIVCSDGGDSDVFRKESMHDDRVVGDYTCTKLDGAEASIDAEREPRTGKHTGLSQAEEDSLTLGLRTGKRCNSPSIG